MDDAVKELKRLQGVVARLAENAGLDQSNPKRGINSGAIPSVKNPVAQKLSSLADVQTYNVLDKQVLSWSQQGQKWLPMTPEAGGSGAQWELATDDEHLDGLLDSDSDYDSTQVKALREAAHDSYGLVGTSTTSAFLHGAKRSSGDTKRAHGYVTAQPYYVNMGVVWVEDDPDANWIKWGEMGVDRRDLYFRTPQYQNTWNNPDGDDGAIRFFTNNFLVPQFSSSARPDASGSSPGAMIYDTSYLMPLWFNGTDWVDALGNPPA
jgi:hypothetical protein